MTTPPLTLLQIHEQHARFVWACLHRMGVRQGDLPDQVQEVFIVVHRRLDSYDPAAKVTSWLYGICLKIAAGYRRKASNRREQLGERESAQSGEHPCALTPDGTTSGRSATPEEIVVKRSAHLQLERLLEKLDLEKRTVLVMYEIEEISCRDISEQLGVPIGTVHSRLHAARAELKKHYERQMATRKRQGAA